MEYVVLIPILPIDVKVWFYVLKAAGPLQHRLNLSAALSWESFANKKPEQYNLRLWYNFE